MEIQLQTLVDTYNQAADRFNLARLDYAFSYAAPAPPPALRLPSDVGSWDADQRPVTAAVQSVREYFELVVEGELHAPGDAAAFERMRAAALDLTKRFFQVSLTQLGISCDGIIESD
jgi:hypothetical protein